MVPLTFELGWRRQQKGREAAQEASKDLTGAGSSLR